MSGAALPPVGGAVSDLMSRTTLQDRLERGFGLRWDEDRARNLTRAAATTDVQAALDALLIGETYFFRYPFYLQLVRHRMAAQPSGRAFRVLCPACSSGEEAYSVAYTLAEDAAQQGRRLEIVATDARQSAVAAAEAAAYSEWSLRNTRPEVRDRLLEPVDDRRFRVRDPWRSLPRFAVRNLLEPPTDGPFDAILLSNATLYMSPAAAERAYRHMASVLAPDGVMLLAPTDPAPGDGWYRRDELVGWSVFSRGTAPLQVAVPVAAAPRATPASTTRAALKVTPPRTMPPPDPPRAAPAASDGGTDAALWDAWASGKLDAAHDRIRERVFYEPDEPLWRFLHGAVLWERGWLKRAQNEIQAAGRLLAIMPRSASVRGLCTVEELTRMVAFWSEHHG